MKADYERCEDIFKEQKYHSEILYHLLLFSNISLIVYELYTHLSHSQEEKTKIN